MGWLEGQVAIVTGGGSGIGLAVVERFVAEGARVGVLERSAARVEELQQHFGDDIVACPGDVTRLDDNARIVAMTRERFGRLDAFIGNAGIWDYMVGLEKQPADRLEAICDELFAVNVKGYILGARAAIDALRETRGTLIFTASSSSFYTGGGGPIYIASKHAVVGLVRALAAELAPEIRVNAVAPGGTITNLGGGETAGMAGARLAEIPDIERTIGTMTPLGYAAEPKHHAAIYVLLASRESSPYVTGTVVSSDGGIGLQRNARND